jgi:beta-mannosidase
MKKISLNGKWKLLGRQPQLLLQEKINFPVIGNEGWMTSDVPGDINYTLLQNKKISDPRYDVQGKDCYWITGQEWWYCLEFSIPDIIGGNADLCLTGIDGNSEIWLNDNYLGEMKNSFRLHRFSVGEYLKLGANILLICFKSIDQLLGGTRLDELHGWYGRMAFIRKPQYTLDIDWVLPIPSLGLAGDVWIEYDNQYSFVDYSIQTFISGRIDLGFEVTRHAKEEGYIIEVKISGHGIEVFESITRNSYKSYLSLQIPDPILW